MAANYFAIGMLLATVTLRDGRLELAIGLHAVNNVFLALVANYEGSALMTESIFTARELDPWYSLATLMLGGVVFHWWVFGRAARAKNNQPQMNADKRG
jgi:membrane protease YdiL (CAAX protease family)